MIRAVLVEKDLWAVVDKPPQLPAVEPAEKEAKAAYHKALSDDEKALAVITIHVSSHLLHLIREDATAHQAWTELQHVYAARSSARVMQLLEEFQGLRIKPKESLSTYFGRGQSLVHQLTDAGEETKDGHLQRQLLMGLGREYEALVDSITEFDVPVNELLARLQVKEARINKNSKPQSTGHALPASSANVAGPSRSAGPSRAPAPCWNCGLHNHMSRECKKPKTKCSKCGKKGHLARFCYQKEGCSAKVAGSEEAVAFVTTHHAFAYDASDWMLQTDLFLDLHAEFGPFTLDGASDAEGTNSHLPRWCSKSESFLERDLAGERVWLNPPFRQAGTFLAHYLEQKELYPDLEGMFVLPYKPEASWWHLLKGMKEVRHFSAGTQLFTKPDGRGGRKQMHECPFDVVVYYDAGVKASASTMGLRPSTRASFVMDSGASYHFVQDPALLEDYRTQLLPQDPKTVTVGNKECLRVQGKGAVLLHTVIAGEPVQVRLQEVYYVPGLSANLISLSKLTDSGAAVQMQNEKLTVSKNGSVYLFATKNKNPYRALHGLYVLKDARVAGTVLTAQMPEHQKYTPTIPMLCHARYGHMDFSTIAKLPEVVNGCEVTKKECAECSSGPLCRTCAETRSTRLPRRP